MTARSVTGRLVEKGAAVCTRSVRPVSGQYRSSIADSCRVIARGNAGMGGMSKKDGGPDGVGAPSTHTPILQFGIFWIFQRLAGFGNA